MQGEIDAALAAVAVRYPDAIGIQCHSSAPDAVRLLLADGREGTVSAAAIAPDMPARIAALLTGAASATSSIVPA